MKKLFVFFICVIMSVPGWGAKSLRLSNNYQCYYYAGADAVAGSYAWFCGDNSRNWCNSGWRVTSTSKKTYLTHAKTINDNDPRGLVQGAADLGVFANETDITGHKKYHKYITCCNGTTTTKGQFVVSNTRLNSEDSKKDEKDCKIYKNWCGDIVTTSAADDCNNPNFGTVVCTLPQVKQSRQDAQGNWTDRCVVPCEYPNAFTSDTNDTCVECETTNYSGIDVNGVCKKCDPATQLWNKKTKKCVNKSNAKQYTRKSLKDCWKDLSTSISAFKNCVLGIKIIGTYKIPDSNVIMNANVLPTQKVIQSIK